MKIKTSPDTYFHQALGIIQEFPPYNKLTGRERRVLAELMKHKHNGYKPMLNAEVRALICDDLELSPEILRNNISQLRLKGLLVDNEIPVKYLLKYMQPFTFEFYEEES